MLRRKEIPAEAAIPVKFSGVLVNRDPHANQLVLNGGASLKSARAAVILIHGRGSSAQNMLSLFEDLKRDELAAVAPQAFENTWYPHSFLAPIDSNQPFLDSALGRIETIVSDLLSRGCVPDKIALLGFSQGACLTSEFIARHPRPYGAAMILTGGLIGPPGTARDHSGSLLGTRVFLGTSVPDPHVPVERVLETQDVFRRMGAEIELRKYPGMAHTINEDELNACRDSLGKLVGQ